MLLITDILLILIGAGTAVMSLLGDTWNPKKKKLTRVGWVSLCGFLMLAVLAVGKEAVISRRARVLQRLEHLKERVDEIAMAFAQLPLSDLFAEVLLSPKGVEESVSQRGYAQSSIHLFLPDDEPTESEARIIDLLVLPLPGTHSESLDSRLEVLIRHVPNIRKHIDRHLSTSTSRTQGTWLLFCKYGSDPSADWLSYQLDSLTSHHHRPRPLHFRVTGDRQVPERIAGLLGKKVRVWERNVDATGPSIVSEIRFFHSGSAAIPFLTLHEACVEPYGINRWVYDWLPRDAAVIDRIDGPDTPGFLFDLSPLREHLEKTLPASQPRRLFD